MYERKKLAAAAGAAVLMLNAGTLPVHAADQNKKVRLMCLGDSITDGFWLPGGYRNTLCSLISENGQESQVDFVGPNWGGSGYDPQHAGYSGYSIDNIAQENSISGQRTGISSFAEWMLGEYPADVVFLQIGTNDILSLYDLEHFGVRLEGLVDTVLAELPQDGCLYLATLPVMDATNNLYISDYFFTVESMDEAVESCNAQIRAVAEKKQNEGGEPASETTDSPDQPAILRGDVDGNGEVAIADAVKLAKYLCCDGDLTEQEAERADMNADRKLNAADLTLLKRAL